MYSKIWFRGSSNLLSELWQSTLWRTLSRLPTQPGHRPNQFSPRPRVEIVNRHCYPFAILLYTSLRGSVRCRWPCDHRPSSTDTPPPPPYLPRHKTKLRPRAKVFERGCANSAELARAHQCLRSALQLSRQARARLSLSLSTRESDSHALPTTQSNQSFRNERRSREEGVIRGSLGSTLFEFFVTALNRPLVLHYLLHIQTNCKWNSMFYVERASFCCPDPLLPLPSLQPGLAKLSFSFTFSLTTFFWQSNAKV